jgi:hypothetical protein
MPVVGQSRVFQDPDPDVLLDLKLSHVFLLRLIGDIRTTRTSGDRNKNTTRLVCLAQEVATPSPS